MKNVLLLIDVGRLAYFVANIWNGCRTMHQFLQTKDALQSFEMQYCYLRVSYAGIYLYKKMKHGKIAYPRF